MRPALPDIPSGLEWGRVGWSDSTSSDYFELGDGSDTDAGLTLVRVTLFRGRNPAEPIDASKAQGYKILCQLGDTMFCVPPLGTRVHVSIPDSHALIPGAATIVRAVDPRGTQVYGSNYSSGDVVVVAMTSSARLVLKGDGSASLVTDGATIELDKSGNVTLAGSDSAVALATIVDSFIKGVILPVTPYAPSPTTEPAFANFVANIGIWASANWTRATTGSSKVKAGA